MDPFTQKLLERTQARKEQLAMKRVELAACRSKRNGVPSPAKPRQPLSENNTDSNVPKEVEIKPAKPTAPVIPSSPAAKKPLEKVDSPCRIAAKKPLEKLESPRRIAAKKPLEKLESPSVKRERILSDPSSTKAAIATTPNHNRRARIFSDPSSPAAGAKKQLVADVGESKRQRIVSDGSVPSSPAASRLRAQAEIDAESPSIQARRQRLLEMQKKDSAVTPKKHWKKALNMNPEDNSSPSIAARSAAFLTQDATPIKPQTPQMATTKTPGTPGRLAGARNIFEKEASATKSEGRPAKINLVGPPKPPRIGDVDTVEKHTTKRKAPAPPSKTPSKDGNEEKSSNSDSDGYDYRVVAAKTSEPVSAKRQATGRGVEGSIRSQDGYAKEKKPADQEMAELKPRKRSQDTGDNIDGKEQNEVQDDRERRREERKKARIEMREKGNEVVVSSSSSKRLGRENSREDEAVIQACAVVNTTSRKGRDQAVSVKAVAVDCSVKRVPTFERKEIPQKSVKVLSIGNVDGASNKADESQEICDAILQAVEEDNIKATSKRSGQKSSFRAQKNQDFEFKVPSAGPFKLQGGERNTLSSEDEDQSELDETVNLNDVDIHEMTFTFDFSNFDKIEEERETKFQKSFNEKCQELKKEEPVTSREELKPVVDQTDMGVYKSGYQSTAVVDDQYAAKALAKTRPAVPARPQATHDRLKELLDQAASQQNIVLQMSQALNVCTASQDIFGGSQEEIEAERVLLLAAERKQACLNEHQRLKSRPHESMRGRGRGGIGQPCSATLSISGIQLSLRQDFMDMLRVGIRHDLGVFHFVIHIQNGPLEITSSKTLSTNDCTEGNTLTFPDKFVLQDLDPKFAVYVKVFGMNVQKRLPNTLTPNQKQKLFQSPKVTKHKDSPAALPVFRHTNFKLVGVARITLPTVNSKKFGLEYLPEGCPLNNSVHLKIRCTPLYKCLVKGFLTILEDIGGYNAWQRRWCVLEGGMLSQWRYPGDETTKPPLGSLDLGQCVSTVVTTVSRDLCARPNTMEVIFKKGDDDVRYLLACDTKADKVTWLDSLNEALKDFKAWSSCHMKALYPDLGHIEGDKKGPRRPSKEPARRDNVSQV